MKRIATAAILAAGLLFSGQASATSLLFDSVGDTYTINFQGGENGSDITGLTGQLTLTLADLVGSDNFVFDYVQSNTASGPVTAARISAFGFDLTPSFLVASVISGSVFDGFSSGSMSGGVSVGGCLTAGPNCAGGGGGGVLIGNSTSGRFSFVTLTGTGMLTLSNLHLRGQSIDAPTLGIRGGSALYNVIEGGGGNNAVPEPATWAMMLLGFGSIGATIRHRRRLAYA